MVVAADQLPRVLRALVEGPIEPSDPDLASVLLDAIVDALIAGAFPTTTGSVRRWLDAVGIPYTERRWTVTHSEGSAPVEAVAAK